MFSANQATQSEREALLAGLEGSPDKAVPEASYR